VAEAEAEAVGSNRGAPEHHRGAIPDELSQTHIEEAASSRKSPLIVVRETLTIMRFSRAYPQRTDDLRGIGCSGLFVVSKAGRDGQGAKGHIPKILSSEAGPPIIH
jgi:hypothetical protein